MGRSPLLQAGMSFCILVARFQVTKYCPNEAFSIHTLMIFHVDVISANQSFPKRPQVPSISRNLQILMSIMTFEIKCFAVTRVL